MEIKPVELVRKPKPFDRDEAARAYDRSHSGQTPRPVFIREKGRLRVFQQDPAPFYEAGFREILATRMRGLPILNPRMNVKVLPFKRIGPHWFGVAVTPWSVQAVLACGEKARWKPVAAGAEIDIPLPSGPFTFLGVADSVLGQYLMCSLKSPVTDFADQAAAEAFAGVCLQLMLSKKKEDVPEDEPGEKLTPARPVKPAKSLSDPVTRRALFSDFTDGGADESH